MTKEIDVDTWEEFERELAKLHAEWHASGKRFQSFQYRGQQNSEWTLSTTLERYHQHNFSIREYYRVAASIRPQVETFTGASWGKFDFGEVAKRLADYDPFSRDLTFGQLPAYDYLAYLRHHGFPSPLLDWTHSPYIGAFFAFRNESISERVSVYVLIEANMRSGGSGQPGIRHLGPTVKTHRRHFLQQSSYTVCTFFDREEGWRFVEHDGAWNSESDDSDDLFMNFSLVKFSIPSKERKKVLTALNRYNLNAYSLFGSEESLMETIAYSEFFLD